VVAIDRNWNLFSIFAIGAIKGKPSKPYCENSPVDIEYATRRQHIPIHVVRQCWNIGSAMKRHPAEHSGRLHVMLRHHWGSVDVLREHSPHGLLFSLRSPRVSYLIACVWSISAQRLVYSPLSAAVSIWLFSYYFFCLYTCSRIPTGKYI